MEVGIDEVGAEKSVQAWQEKGKVGKTGLLDLGFWVMVLCGFM